MVGFEGTVPPEHVIVVENDYLSEVIDNSCSSESSVSSHLTQAFFENGISKKNNK